MLKCQELKSILKIINELKSQFDSAYGDCDSTLGTKNPDNRKVMDKADKLKDQIEILILEIENGLTPETTFAVENALNPYHEAYVSAGITDEKSNPERKDLIINLQEILMQDREAYENVGAVEWTNDIPQSIEDFNLTQEQVELIKSRVEQGEIPIVMPGRRAQINGLLKAINRLRPIWIEDGEDKWVRQGSVWDVTRQLIGFMKKIANVPDMNADQEDELKNDIKQVIYSDDDPQILFEAVNSIPENPYIFMIRPSQAPDERTRDKTFEEQTQEFEKIKGENPNVDLQIFSFAECIALQNRFTWRAKAGLDEKKIKYQVLRPLDYWEREERGTNFNSRFINLPWSHDESCFDASFLSDDNEFLFSWDEVSDNVHAGFRYGVRVGGGKN